MTATEQLPPDVVVLAGGLGTRLRGVVADRPKVLAEIAGVPYLQLLLKLLEQTGVQRVIIATGHGADAVERWVASCFKGGLDVQCSPEPSPMGTAGALRLALGACHSDYILALNGDSFSDFDWVVMADQLRAEEIDACVWLVQTEDAGRFGSVVVDGDGRIREFLEKSASGGGGLINAGAYLFRASCLATIPLHRACSMERDLLPGLSRQGKLHGCIGRGPFIDIGTPDDYSAAETFVRRYL